MGENVTQIALNYWFFFGSNDSAKLKTISAALNVIRQFVDFSFFVKKAKRQQQTTIFHHENSQIFIIHYIFRLKKMLSKGKAREVKLHHPIEESQLGNVFPQKKKREK